MDGREEKNSSGYGGEENVEKRKKEEKNPLHSDVDAQSQQNYSHSLITRGNLHF